ncbi:unnamed protein product [Ascophyllum nodosum]
MLSWDSPLACWGDVLPFFQVVFFEEKIAMMYDVNPKLRIMGSGFDTLDASNVKFKFAPKISAEDYSIDIISSRVITLNFKEGKKWIQLDAGSSPTKLYLSTAKNGDTYLVEDAVHVATVLPTPTVEASSREIYMTTTPKLIVNGTNFNLENTALFFDPPLNEGTVIQKQILSSTQIAITKIYSIDTNVWAPEPGPLKVAAIKTGGGVIMLHPEERGITVAVVQANLDGHGINVNSHEEISIYQSTKQLQVSGVGFRDGLKVRFANALRGGGTIFTITDIQPQIITLDLKEGSKWRGNVDSLPGPLVLLAANVGDGWVPLGPTRAKAGRKVATVFEDPSIEPNNIEIYRTHTHELMIKGTGFNKLSPPVLDFEPPLNSAGVYLQVMNRTSIMLSLSSTTSQWTSEDKVGPLTIKAIDTGAGKISFDAPIQVAKVLADSDKHESGVQDGGVTVAVVQANLEGHGITVNSHEEINIYQSTKRLHVSGAGFKEGLMVYFSSVLLGGGTNYTITDIQPEIITIDLKEGSRWRESKGGILPGPLVLLATNVGDGWVHLGPSWAKAGRKVATVFEDPSIEPNSIQIYRTHTRELIIKGTGFNKLSPPVIDFEPPLDFAGVYVQVMNRTNIMVSLSSTTSQWTSEDKVGPLTIKAIDTGAGKITFDAPIQVAKVVADSEVHESGVQVFPSYGDTKYQSSKMPLHIYGAGFKGEPKLNFDPPIWTPANYTLTVVAENELRLDLMQGSLWNKLPGALMVKGINVGDGEVSLAKGLGVKVATILEDPVVKEADMHIYTTHTKHFPVRGSGFVSVQDPGKAPVVVIDGISSANFKIQDNWHNGVMNLQLMSGAWSTLTEGEIKPLKIMSIDTGAGVVDFPGGIQIALVREDSTTALCEDSCSFAEDGQCDEPGVAFGTSGSYGGYSSYYSDILSYNPYGLGWGYDDDANSFLATNDYSGMYRYAGYDTTYQYYGMSDDGFFAGMAPCEVGTDCTDCGVKVVADGTCLNTCQHSRDGFCDDPRAGGVCPSGTDCQDCGPWGDANSNFTETTFYMSSSWFDDDDWELMMNDDGIYYGQSMNNQPVYKRNWNDHKVVRQENAGAGTIFVNVLWAMVVLVGCSMSLGVCMVAYRHFKAGGGGAPMYLPVQAAEEVELSKRHTSRSETTPDVVRIG